MATVDELKYIINAEDGNFTAAVNKVRKEHDKTAKKIEKPVKFNINTDQSLRNISKVGNALSRLGAITGIAFGVKEIIGFTRETTKAAGEVENLRRAFDNLAKKDGLNAVKLLQDLRDATQGATSDQELLQNATQARFLGIDLKNLPKFFEFATKRSRETGESVNFLVSSIVRGVGRKSALILDNLGIQIKDVQAEQIKIAKAQGIWNGKIDESVNALTFQDAALKIANQGIDEGATLAENAATNQERLNAAFSNLAVSLGKINEAKVSETSGFLTELVTAYNNFVTIRELDQKVSPPKSFKELRDEVVKTGSVLDQILFGLNPVNIINALDIAIDEGFKGVKDNLVEYNEESKKTVSSLEAEAEALNKVDAAQKSVTETTDKFAEARKKLRDERLTADLANLEKQFKKSTKAGDDTATPDDSIIGNIDVTTALFNNLLNLQESVNQRRLESNRQLAAETLEIERQTAAQTKLIIGSVLDQIESQVGGVVGNLLRLASIGVRAAAAIGSGNPLGVIPLIGGAIGGISDLFSSNLTANISPQAQGGNFLNNLSAAPPQGAINSGGISAAQFQQNNRELVEAVQGIRIEINSELDAIRFYRKTLPGFNKANNGVTF